MSKNKDISVFIYPMSFLTWFLGKLADFCSFIAFHIGAIVIISVILGLLSIIIDLPNIINLPAISILTSILLYSWLLIPIFGFPFAIIVQELYGMMSYIYAKKFPDNYFKYRNYGVIPGIWSYKIEFLYKLYQKNEHSRETEENTL